MGIFDDTLASLDAARRDFGPAAVVAFSGGKDSLACLDLATRSFDRVSAFYMYMVPGLACVEQALEYARRRWKVEIRQYPHWELRRSLQNGIYCDPGPWTDGLVEWSLADVFGLARGEAHAGCVVHGAKKADSVWRRRTLATVSRDRRVYPLETWGKRDVLAYLTARKIPVPDAAKGDATGIDLSHASLCWLHDKHPRDFALLCEVFPYAEAAVWRRTFYGATHASQGNDTLEGAAGH